MKLEDQVSSLELSQKLKALGVPQESIFDWVRTAKDGEYPWVLTPKLSAIPALEWCSAFTVAELGEMLPHHTPSMKDGQGYTCSTLMSEDGDDTHWDHIAQENDFDAQSIFGGTEADARSKMLCYLIEKKLVKP